MQGAASGAVKRAQAAGKPPTECMTPTDLLPIRRLLDAAADPNQACSQSAVPCAISPLLFATHVGDGAIVGMLLAANAMPDHPDPRVPKPLLVACANSNAPCAKLLLEAVSGMAFEGGLPATDYLQLPTCHRQPDGRSMLTVLPPCLPAPNACHCQPQPHRLTSPTPTDRSRSQHTPLGSCTRGVSGSPRRAS